MASRIGPVTIPVLVGSGGVAALAGPGLRFPSLSRALSIDPNQEVDDLRCQVEIHARLCA